MIAEILATGDEIRSGALVDTNSAYISEKLEETGLEVARHQCVGDELSILEGVLLEISQRSDVAVVTGGLGPTTDDLTAEAASKAAGVPLVLNEQALKDIELIFEKFNRPMSPSNRKQAMLPEDSACLYNSEGTAPGFSMQIGKCRFYFLPGVPFEMKKMLTDHVLPDIAQLLGDEYQKNMLRTISTFGLGESLIGEKVAGITEKFPEIKLGLRAKFPEIQVKLYMRGRDENAMNRTLDSAVEWVHGQLGKYIFSDDGRTMERIIGDLLKERTETVSIAESCTGGLISDWLTNVPGSSAYFLFSGVTYSNESKINVLGVKQDTIDQFGAVSEEAVREMAEGVRRISGSDYGLATSGIAGPDGGTEEKPVGTLWMGLAGPERTVTKKFVTALRRPDSSYGNRTINKNRFAMAALEMFRRELMGKLNN